MIEDEKAEISAIKFRLQNFFNAARSSDPVIADIGLKLKCEEADDCFKDYKLFAVRKPELNTSITSAFFLRLRKELVNFMGLDCGTRIIQVLSDTAAFSPVGTKKMLDIFVAHKNLSDSLIEFGYTGEKDSDYSELSGNAMVHYLLELGIIDSDHVLANIVGASFLYPCWVSDRVKFFMATYNDDDDISRQTNFGDDVDVSDKIMKTGDCAYLFEGGPQSLLQCIHMLERDVIIHAVKGLRKPNQIQRFSTAAFLLHLKRKYFDIAVDRSIFIVQNEFNVYKGSVCGEVHASSFEAASVYLAFFTPNLLAKLDSHVVDMS